MNCRNITYFILVAGLLFIFCRYRRRAADEAETIDKHSDKTGSSTKRKNKDRKSSSGRGKAKKRNKQDESDAESQAPTVAMFWAQCEACKKWRSLPIKWNPDTDFFCTDNKWDATRQTCEAPEEQWEQGGNYVVEVSAAHFVTFECAQSRSGDHCWFTHIHF